MAYSSSNIHTCEVSLDILEEVQNYTVTLEGLSVYLENYDFEHVIVCGQDQPEWEFYIPKIIEREDFDPETMEYEFRLESDKLK